MKKFKQALSKGETKKGKQNTTLKNFSKTSKYKNSAQLNSLVECIQPEQYTQKSVEKINFGFDMYERVIEKINKNYQPNQHSQKLLQILIQQVYQILNGNKDDDIQHRKQSSKKKAQQCLKILQQICKRDKNNEKEKVQLFCQELSQYTKKYQQISKNKTLQDYDRLVKILSPTHFGNQKIKLKKKCNNFNEPVPTNLNVRVTREQYQIKQSPSISDQKSPSHLQKLKSKSKQRIKSIGSNRSSTDKLKGFLSKQKSYKVIKTKVQYDYSAILDASKSKVRSRKANKTTVPQNKKNQMWQTKMNKVKKDQGFVFYRPAQGKNQSLLFGGKGK